MSMTFYKLTEKWSVHVTIPSFRQCQTLAIVLNQERAPKILLNRFSPPDDSAISLDREALSPADGKPMLLLLNQGIEIDYCAGSNSVWLDKRGIGKACSKRRGEEKGMKREG